MSDRMPFNILWIWMGSKADSCWISGSSNFFVLSRLIRDNGSNENSWTKSILRRRDWKFYWNCWVSLLCIALTWHQWMALSWAFDWAPDYRTLASSELIWSNGRRAGTTLALAAWHWCNSSWSGWLNLVDKCLCLSHRSCIWRRILKRKTIKSGIHSIAIFALTSKLQAPFISLRLQRQLRSDFWRCRVCIQSLSGRSRIREPGIVGRFHIGRCWSQI